MIFGSVRRFLGLGLAILLKEGFDYFIALPFAAPSRPFYSDRPIVRSFFLFRRQVSKTKIAFSFSQPFVFELFLELPYDVSTIKYTV